LTPPPGDLSAAIEASSVAWERTMAQSELAIANVTLRR
jgi:hypothetical protein